MKEGPPNKSLMYCWTCDTPGHLGRLCSLMSKDPDFRPVKNNILYPHKRKKHIQEMLREVKEQMNCEVEVLLDSRLLITNNGLDDDNRTTDLPNEAHDMNYPTTMTSPVLSDQIDLTLDHQSRATESIGPKENNENIDGRPTVIDLTDKINKEIPLKHHEELPKESFKNTINFLATINMNTHTIEGQYYNTTNSGELSVPKTVGSSSLDELHSKIDEQARVLSEQQKVIHGIQHLQKQIVPNTQTGSLPHQTPPYDSSIPPPDLVSTPQRTNDFDEERTVQVEGPLDAPQAEYNKHSDHKLNQYPNKYNDDYPPQSFRDQDFGYDDKTHMKREPLPSHLQQDPIKNDDNSNLLDDTLTQLLQNQNDIQQKTCELLTNLSNKPPGAEFMHYVLTDVTVYDGKNILLECWLLQIEKAHLIHKFTSL